MSGHATELPASLSLEGGVGDARGDQSRKWPLPIRVLTMLGLGAASWAPILLLFA